MFLGTLRFDLKEQDTKRLKEFFSRDEIKAAREKKDKKYKEIKIEPISDTKEPDELEVEVIVIGTIGDKTSEPQLLENSTQLRALGRKRKQREDDTFKYHQVANSTPLLLYKYQLKIYQDHGKSRIRCNVGLNDG